MRISLSLRKKFILLMSIILSIQTAALLFSLRISNVFNMLDNNSFTQFSSLSKNAASSFNKNIGFFLLNLSEKSKQISAICDDSINSSDEKTDKEKDTDLSLKASEVLLDIIKNNNVSGAFFIFDDPFNTGKKELNSVFIRNNSSNPDDIKKNDDLYLNIGPSQISNNYLLPTALSWDLTLNDTDKILSSEFYKNPVNAALSNPYQDIIDYGYWSKPIDVLSTNEEFVTYTLPIIGSDGKIYGVLGTEFNPNYFIKSYFGNIQLPFENSFYVITNIENDKINTDGLISNSPIAYVHLPKNGTIPIEKSIMGSYKTNLAKLGKMYIIKTPLKLYSGSSKFSGTNTNLIGFASENSLRKSSAIVRRYISLTFIVTGIISLILIFAISYLSTINISRLLEYIKKANPYDPLCFEPTGTDEIDNLAGAVLSLQKNLISNSQTVSRILELSLLPIGGFEIHDDAQKVTLTKFVYNLLEIDYDKPIPLEEWLEYYKSLTSHPYNYNPDIYEYTSKSGQKMWLRIRQQQIDTGSFGVITDITAEITERKKLKKQLEYDAMTGLLKRRYFIQKSDKKILDDPNKIGAVIFSDLDNLKYINDTFGHEVGDTLIKESSKIFEQFNLVGGLSSRISGDEFAIFLYGYDSRDQILDIIDEIFSDNSENYIKTPDNEEFKIRFSSGLAWYPENSLNTSDLLKFADYAMYEAKSTDKGTLKQFDEATYRRNFYIMKNADTINTLIDQKLLYFAFQPILDINTSRIFACEALMRSRVGTIETAPEIFNVAKSQSKLRPLEKLVFNTIFETMHDNPEIFDGIKIFANSIPSHMIKYTELLGLKEKYNIDLKKLVIEITETECEIFDVVAENINQIRSLGIDIALDDFGRGYSGEHRILQINPNIIKVDMELVRDIHLHANKQKLFLNLVSFSRPLGIKVLAEGIETAQELQKVQQLGADYAQGFLIGKPSENLNNFKALCNSFPKKF